MGKAACQVAAPSAAPSPSCILSINDGPVVAGMPCVTLEA
jgi:hypothetical protein